MRQPTSNERDALESMLQEIIDSDEAYWCQDVAILYLKELLSEGANGPGVN